MAILDTYKYVADRNGNTNVYVFYLEVIQNSQSIADNTSNITVNHYGQARNGWGFNNFSTPKSYISIDGVQKKETTVASIPTNGAKTLIGTWSGDVTHNSDGTLSLAVSARFAPNTTAYGYVPVENTVSGTAQPATIPRASQVTVSSYTIANTTGSLTATITPEATVFYHRWRWKTVSSWSAWTNIGNITTRTNVTVSNTDLLADMPTVTSGAFTIQVQTHSGTAYNSSTLIGSASATATVSIDTSVIKPSVSVRSLGIASTRISGVAIAGYSTVETRISTTNSSGASSFTVYISSNKGTLDTTTSTTASTDVTTNTLPSSKNDYTLTISAYAVDSRGTVSRTVSQSITVYGYQPPAATLNAYRTATNASSDTTEDGAGNYVYVTFSGTINSPVGGRNSISSSGIVCTYAGSISGTATNGAHYRLSGAQSVTFTLTVTDKVASTTVTKLVSPARYPLDLYDDGSGNVGVGFATNATSNSVSSALPFVVKSTDRPRMLARDLTHNGDIRLTWDSAHKVHGLYSIGYSTDGATLTDSNLWLIQRTATGAVLVNGVNIPDDLFYKPGETITLTNGVMSGWVTSSTKNLQLYLNLSKRLDNIASINVTKFIITTRGISGYVEGSTQFDMVENTDYTISYSIDTVGNGILFTIGKASAAYTGATNNTVVSSLIRNIVLELS